VQQGNSTHQWIIEPGLWSFPQAEGAKSFLQCLDHNGYPSALVGGCVRDRLMGEMPKDLDIATTATPEEVLKVAKTNHWPAYPTGLAHGTVTVVFEGIPFELTTLRKDLHCDGRHASVAFSDSFQEDAARRDFTVNSLYLFHDGHLYDPFSGREDLIHQRLRFVGDPRQRIEEDALRMLRYFRFLARWDWPVDPAILRMIQQQASLLSHVALERQRDELLAFFGPFRPHLTRLLLASGLLEPLWGPYLKHQPTYFRPLPSRLKPQELLGYFHFHQHVAREIPVQVVAKAHRLSRNQIKWLEWIELLSSPTAKPQAFFLATEKEPTLQSVYHQASPWILPTKPSPGFVFFLHASIHCMPSNTPMPKCSEFICSFPQKSRGLVQQTLKMTWDLGWWRDINSIDPRQLTLWIEMFGQQERRAPR
jgi:tRNA nucleotidyltransferase/poly(A) polymerase